METEFAPQSFEVDHHSHGLSPMPSTSHDSGSEVGSHEAGENKSPSLLASPEPPETCHLLLNGEYVELPLKLFENEDIFRSVVSREGFDSLSEDSQMRLKDFEGDLELAFTDNCFVSPPKLVYQKAQEGYYDHPHTADTNQLQSYYRVLHNHFIRNHSMKLLRRLITSRNKILNRAMGSGFNDDLNVGVASLKRPREREVRVCSRAKYRLRMLKHEMRRVSGTEGLPSDSSDEENSHDVPKPFKPTNKEAKSTLFDPDMADCDLDMYQQTHTTDIKTMLKRYKHLRETRPNHPTLDIVDITLEEVYERVGLSYQSEKNHAMNVCGAAPPPPKDKPKKKTKKEKEQTVVQ